MKDGVQEQTHDEEWDNCQNAGIKQSFHFQLLMLHNGLNLPHVQKHAFQVALLLEADSPPLRSSSVPALYDTHNTQCRQRWDAEE